MSESRIKLEQVSFSYPPATPDGAPIPALHDISLSIAGGELLALIGQNGSGKTTLAKHLNGLLKPSSGRVLAGGVDTRQESVGMLARQSGYVFQNPDHQLFLPTVREEVEYGPARLGLSGSALEERVAGTLERFGLKDEADRHPAGFGRGMRRLTVLAAVYAMHPQVLVLDEPTGGLDRNLTARLMALLEELTAEGRAIVLVTHDMRLVADHADRVVLMRDGRTLADDAPAALFDREELLAEAGMHAPEVVQLAAELRECGFPRGVSTVEQFVRAYADCLENREVIR